MPDCYDCDGTGEVEVEIPDSDDYRWEDCPACDGSGWVEDEDE